MSEQLELFTSNWGVRNDVAHLQVQLEELIPLEGPVTNVNKNKALEKFRKAQNVVYDIFNNGLMNRGKQLKVLGLMRYDLALEEYRNGECIMRANWDRVEEVVCEAFTPIIQAAAKEQGIQ